MYLDIQDNGKLRIARPAMLNTLWGCISMGRSASENELVDEDESNTGNPNVILCDTVNSCDRYDVLNSMIRVHKNYLNLK